MGDPERLFLPALGTRLGWGPRSSHQIEAVTNLPPRTLLQSLPAPWQVRMHWTTQSGPSSLSVSAPPGEKKGKLRPGEK